MDTYFHKVFIAEIKQNIQNYCPQCRYTHLRKMYLYHCLPDQLVSHVVCTGRPHLKTWLPKFVCLGAYVKSGIPVRSSNMRCIYPLHFGCFSPSEGYSDWTVCTKFTNMPWFVLGLWLVSINIYYKLATNTMWGYLQTYLCNIVVIINP